MPNSDIAAAPASRIDSSDAESLKQRITALATRAVRAECGVLAQTVGNEKRELHVIYLAPGVAGEGFENFPDALGLGAPCRMPQRIDDISKHPGLSNRTPVRSLLAVPVIAVTGELLGALYFGHTRPDIFGDEEEWIAHGMAVQAAISIDAAARQRALNRSNEELTRANCDLNDFAYSASHDLQEPLRIISIFTQLLRRKLAGTMDEEADEHLGSVLRGTRRLQALVRDFLAYNQAAAIVAGEPPITDAGVALDLAVANLKAATEQAGALIERGPLPSVRIRPIPLTQVFQHLLGNAIKYQREQPPRVAITAARHGTEWIFSVEDNGIGIEERYKEQVFGIFKRLHTADEHSGTGIGLAICRRIIERAGGRIWLESEPGRGSIFRFTLPGGT